jgi:predicted small secreted protein
MVNKKFLVGMLVLVFGLVLTSCDTNSGTTDGLDTTLNGTWSSGSGDELKLNNGSFENLSDGDVISKGTYTTSGNNITIKTIQSRMGMASVNSEGVASEKYLSDFFSTKAEYMAAMEKMYKEAGISGTRLAEKLAEDEKKADELLAVMFTPQTITYSISGKILTIGERTYNKN